MSNKKTGGSAFPASTSTVNYGITMRDYFAAKAMQAAAMNPTGAEGFTFSQRAEWAYQQADAMIAERAK